LFDCYSVACNCKPVRVRSSPIKNHILKWVSWW